MLHKSGMTFIGGRDVRSVLLFHARSSQMLHLHIALHKTQSSCNVATHNAQVLGKQYRDSKVSKVLCSTASNNITKHQALSYLKICKKQLANRWRVFSHTGWHDNGIHFALQMHHVCSNVLPNSVHIHLQTLTVEPLTLQQSSKAWTRVLWAHALH